MTRKTKIIATIGPATFSKEIIKRLVLRGVNVCRINFSHIDHAKAKEVINSIKEVNQELHVHTAILADLQGPKIRIGELEKPMRLTKGMQITLCTRKRKGKIYVNYSKFAKEVCVNDKVLIDDGKLILIATHTNHKDTVRLKVVFGGMLYSNKGINLPNTKISMPCLTHKDKQDLKFVLNEKIEWIGLSFVRSAEDVKKLKRIIKLKKSHHKVIAKIEKPQAIKDIDAIIQETDAIMVARGDLGVEVLPQKVPVYQKMIVEKCMKHSKPVVIATQMLESMTKNPTATRAEVNDVANSVIDGADAVMLSGETSVGAFPLHAVEAMHKIVADVEKEFRGTRAYQLKEKHGQRHISDAICYNSCKLAEQVGAEAIITMTHSGYNAIEISSYRPPCKVFAFTNNHAILNTLSLVWGVTGFYYDNESSTDDTIQDTKHILKEQNFLEKNQLVINVASMPIKEKGMTNMMKLSYVK